MGELDQDDGSLAYTEASAFVRLLGTPGRVKILDVLLGKHYEPLAVNEIADLADIHQSTVHRNIADLIELDVVEEADHPSNAVHYQLNKENEIARTLGELRDQLVEGSGAIPREQPKGVHREHEDVVQGISEVFDIAEELKNVDQSDAEPDTGRDVLEVDQEEFGFHHPDQPERQQTGA